MTQLVNIHELSGPSIAHAVDTILGSNKSPFFCGPYVLSLAVGRMA